MDKCLTWMPQEMMTKAEQNKTKETRVYMSWYITLMCLPKVAKDAIPIS